MWGPLPRVVNVVPVWDDVSDAGIGWVLDLERLEKMVVSFC